jgi:hypothetical protein
MRKTAMLVVFAGMLVGCATGPSYTKQGPNNDKQAMDSALDKCNKSAQVACSPPGDGYRMCFNRNVKTCMEGEGWTEK